MRPNAGVKITADLTPAHFLNGFMAGTARAAGTRKTMGHLLGAEGNYAAVEHARLIDALAVKDKGIAHMYEVGKYGNPKMRLFKLSLVSADSAGSLAEEVVYLDAKLPNKTFAQQGFFKEGPRGGKAKDQSMMKNKWVFYKRAWMLEHGGENTIHAKKKVLSFVSGGELFFRPWVRISYSKNAGKFMAALKASNGGAVMYADEKVTRRMELYKEEFAASVTESSHRSARGAFDAGEKKGFEVITKLAQSIYEDAIRENRVQ